MSLRLPPKLLEINVISAHDLAPVSKLLRTFTVAWVHPDRKFRTRVDRQGNGSPVWNEKFVFPVDQKLLSTDTSAITLEIYSVSWLRDIPIGTACLILDDLIPLSSWFKNTSTARLVSLRVRGPSGRLQGTLNVGVNLLDATAQSLPLSSHLSSAASISNVESMPTKNTSNSNSNHDKKDPKIELSRSQSERTVSQNGGRYWVLSRSGSVSSQLAKATMTNGSICSFMRPLPSEVAAEMSKALYASSANEVGSSVFENWTVAGDREEEFRQMKVPGLTEKLKTPECKPQLSRRRQASEGAGPFSCFSFACGYEFKLICGTPKGKKRNKKKSLP